jgi:Rps23 Pro-64 3,4-dihydroxylase Tpa1-like proline 4-hydroxylase
MNAPPFSLHPSIDPERLGASFARERRVQIAPFLSDDCAAVLRHHLEAREDWRLVLNAGEKTYEIDRAGQAALSPQQREELDRRVLASASREFQYRFESIRVPDGQAERGRRATLLDRFASFLSSPHVIALLRRITGSGDIDFADAQATSYGPGHFLTLHDDDVAGKGRRAAYVYGLTPEWRAEWGGLLLFHDSGGDIERGLTPAYNVLNIFAVPQAHSVSYVAPSAPRPRISVTGWLRSSA